MIIKSVDIHQSLHFMHMDLQEFKQISSLNMVCIQIQTKLTSTNAIEGFAVIQ